MGAEKKGAQVQVARRIEALEQTRQKLVEAYLRRVVEESVYRRQDEALAEDIALARMELHDADLAEIDVEGVLSFAEVILLDARRLWIEGTLDQRQRLQKILFPRGVAFDPHLGFGTAETAVFFTWLAAVPSPSTEEASPTGFGQYYLSRSA